MYEFITLQRIIAQLLLCCVGVESIISVVVPSFCIVNRVIFRVVSCCPCC